MPPITFDGQSLSVDGRRLWLVSGTVPYAGVGRELWSSRLDAARQAGLNCIETPVVWSLHEPRPGSISFEHDLDLPAFVRLVGQKKMHCIVRLGPFVGEPWDGGGLPAWLNGPAVRSGDAAFLQACSRFMSAVCERLRDLQASLTRKQPGPIVMVQTEHRYFCGDPRLAEGYLAELDRFVRESGITVPIVNSNNLFASAEGQIDGWTSDRHLWATMRQLRTVRPEQPRLAIGLRVSSPPVWGRAGAPALTPAGAMRRLAEVLASGGQYNLSPFHAGIAAGFGCGRSDEDESSFFASAEGPGVPLGADGARGAMYLAVRRISTFASQFGRVFAGLDPGYQPVTVSLDGVGPGKRPGGAASGALCVGPVAVDCRGGQGRVVFVFAPEEGEAVRGATIVLSDGSTLPVRLGEQKVAWALLDTHLVDRSTLDYCNLCAFAIVGRVFVCYGPAGAPGLLSINGSAFEVSVPEGSTPHVEEHEGVTVVVCNESSIDTAYLGAGAVYVGVAGLDEAGQPVAHPDHKRFTRIDGAGVVQTVQSGAGARPAPAPALVGWSVAGTDEYTGGTSDRFAAIEGPATLQQLGAPQGYGWLRLRMKQGAARRVRAAFIQAADRLHLYEDGKLVDVIGAGPGAEPGPLTLALAKGEQTWSLLVDNLGRFASGSSAGEAKGIFGHVMAVAPLRAGTPKIESGAPISPLSARAPVFGLEGDDVTDGRRLTWRLKHARKTPLILELTSNGEPTVVLVGGEAVAVLDRRGVHRVILPAERFSRGVTPVQLAVVGDMEDSARTLKDAVFLEGVEPITAKAQWAFAKWEPPSAAKFRPLGRGGAAGAKAQDYRGRPAWWRGSFTLEGAAKPLWLHLEGLSKGQVFLNGRNLARYFLRTRSNKLVGPAEAVYLPEPWLRLGANELTVFDEHGQSPEGCRLAWSEGLAWAAPIGPEPPKKPAPVGQKGAGKGRKNAST